MALMALYILVGCMVLVALSVDFQWASGGRSTFQWEQTSFRNRMVLLWVCPGPSLLA